MKQIYTNIPQNSVEFKTHCRDRIDLLASRVNLLTGQDKLLENVPEKRQYV